MLAVLLQVVVVGQGVVNPPNSACDPVGYEDIKCVVPSSKQHEHKSRENSAKDKSMQQKEPPWRIFSDSEESREQDHRVSREHVVSAISGLDPVNLVIAEVEAATLQDLPGPLHHLTECDSVVVFRLAEVVGVGVRKVRHIHRYSSVCIKHPGNKENSPENNHPVFMKECCKASYPNHCQQNRFCCVHSPVPSLRIVNEDIREVGAYGNQLMGY